MLLIKNGLIHDMVSPKAYEGDILVDGGKIAAIGKNLDAPEDVWAIDADGKEVYPGFVDAHSHLGLDIYGIGYEGNDYNEMTDVCCPQLRGIDSFNPFDKAIEMALSGGVTTVGTGPGSANVLGGTFFAVKTKGVRVDDMVVKNPVAMKCAFGENPKRCYRDKSVSARMTVAAKLREMLFKTREYLDKKEAAGEDAGKRPAFDMRLEALIPVIKGELPLKAHAHQANDILTAIRIAKAEGAMMVLYGICRDLAIGCSVDEDKDGQTGLEVAKAISGLDDVYTELGAGTDGEEADEQDDVLIPGRMRRDGMNDEEDDRP